MKSKLISIVLFCGLAIPGALMFVFSTLFTIGLVFFEKPNENNPSFLSLLAVAVFGAVLTLIGIEKIKQWMYLLVFASIPVSVLVAGILTVGFVSIIGHPAFVYPTFIVTIPIIPFFVNRFVRKYYEQKAG